MAFSTPDLCDEFPDDVRVLDVELAGFGGRESFAGPVLTVSCFEDNSLVKGLVATPGEGRVLVVDGGGSRRRALLGDMLAQQAADNGWAGVIVHGAVRDVEILRTIDLGVRALGSVPIRSNKRGSGQQDEVITIGSVVVRPGDHVYADATGIVFADHALA